MRGEGGHAEQWATHLTDALVRLFQSPLIAAFEFRFEFEFEFSIRMPIELGHFRTDLNYAYVFWIISCLADQGWLERWELTDPQKRSRENRTKPPAADLSKRPKPTLPKNLGTRTASVQDFSPVELARQITLIGASANFSSALLTAALQSMRCSARFRSVIFITRAGHRRTQSRAPQLIS